MTAKCEFQESDLHHRRKSRVTRDRWTMEFGAHFSVIALEVHGGAKKRSTITAVSQDERYSMQWLQAFSDECSSSDSAGEIE